MSKNPQWDQFSKYSGYLKDLFVSSYESKKAWIVFEGAGYITKLWINGEYVGTHEGSFTQFKFPIKLNTNELIK